MLGEFITRLLILILGYAYPAFECYKIIEQNRVEIEQLRFWCQYWILVAMLTVCERIADVFFSWLPMYGELKLAFVIYLWYPKTKGTGYVYETLLRPVVSGREMDIDRKFLELRARVWDLAIYYWHNCTELGSEKFFELLQFLAGQSARLTNQKSNRNASAQDSAKPNKWSFSPTIKRTEPEVMQPNFAQLHSFTPSAPVIPEDQPYPDSPTGPTSSNDSHLRGLFRFRRHTSHN